MDDEVEAPVDDLEAIDATEADDDLGDGGYTFRCGNASVKRDTT